MKRRFTRHHVRLRYERRLHNRRLSQMTVEELEQRLERHAKQQLFWNGIFNFMNFINGWRGI